MLNDPHSAILAKLLDVSALRAKVHAANIANQNTPGYQAQRVAFDEAFHSALAAGKPVDEIDPVIVAGGGGAEQPDGNNVSLDREIMDQAKNNQLYNTWIALAQGRKKLITTAITAAPGG
jgi:flagellar basal-body rod protein FlgB